jgi:hypothetical protein
LIFNFIITFLVLPIFIYILKINKYLHFNLESIVFRYFFVK